MNLKILFKNTTKYTKSIYDTFLDFHRKKYYCTYTAYTLLVITFILFFLILQIKFHNHAFAFMVCCGLTFFIFWRFFRPVSEISKEYKSDKIQKQKLFTFKFYDKLFIVQDNKQFSEIKYYQLYKVFETDDFFYLYIDKTHSFLLDKSCFKENNPNDFSEKKKKKCWWTYQFVRTHKN